jgi:hypothetical protein
MTEFEMAYLHVELVNSMGMLFTGYFTVFTGFLVASYLVAHKLTRTMTIIGVGMFVFLDVGAIMLNYRTISSLAGLSLKMHGMAQTSDMLTWHSTATTPEWTFDALPLVGVALYSISMIAAVYFFFHCRRVNRKAEIGAEVPKV